MEFFMNYLSNTKTKPSFKIFSLFAKTLFIGAAAMAGFVIAGPMAAILGAIAGTLGSYLLEKSIQNFPA